MRVDLFDFDLPGDRIALRPASPRDSARLLRVEHGTLSDHYVGDLPRLLRAGDRLVFNDTRVIPAQLEGRRGEAKIGATLHKRLDLRRWQAFLRNAKRVKEGKKWVPLEEFLERHFQVRISHGMSDEIHDTLVRQEHPTDPEST